MKTTTLLFTALFFCFSTSFAQKEKPEEFTERYTRTIIAHDCDNFTSYFADYIVLLRNNQAMEKAAMEKQLQGLCMASVKSDKLDYDYYLEHFNREIYSAKDIKTEKKFKDFYAMIQACEHYQLEDGDYLYIGYEHKTENYNDYLLNDGFCFIFRYVDDGYKIVAFAE